MPPEDIEQFMMWQLEDVGTGYIENVLEYMIYNLRPDITSVIKELPKQEARDSLYMLYNCCVMLNPGLDVEKWNVLSHGDLFKDSIPSNIEQLFHGTVEGLDKEHSNTPIKLNKTKLAAIRSHLEKTVVGQDEAINEVLAMLTRNAVGLGEQGRPLGVFLFSGSSGVGKTLLAKELHQSIFGKSQIVRLDCGEYQHKHENQKILGSPTGYVGSDEGGQLTNALLKQPNTVLLLDEVEKAHPDIWNTFLTAFDEGFMTDNKGKRVSLQNVIVIMTTNLGNDKIVDRMTHGGIGFSKDQVGFIDDKNARKISRSEIEKLSKKAIRDKFSPEFQNRIDKIVVFNHLSYDNMIGIARLELEALDKKLSRRNYKLSSTDDAIKALADCGANPIQGARGIARMRRDVVENKLAELLIEKTYPKNTTFCLSYEDEFQFQVTNTKNKKELLAIND